MASVLLAIVFRMVLFFLVLLSMFFVGVLFSRMSVAFFNVQSIPWLNVVEDRRVIPAVKINISFDEKMAGEQAAAVAQQGFEEIVGLPLWLSLAPIVQSGREAETNSQQQR